MPEDSSSRSTLGVYLPFRNIDARLFGYGVKQKAALANEYASID